MSVFSFLRPQAPVTPNPNPHFPSAPTSSAGRDDRSKPNPTLCTQGVKQVKHTDLDARFLFLAPPSLDILEKRLRGRATEDEEGLAKRLDQARRELDYAQTADVHDAVVVNDDLDTAYKELRDFIFAAKDGGSGPREP